MLTRYRISLVATGAMAVVSAIFGALSLWELAWVFGALALAGSQVVRHFNSMVTVRGVETVLRRALKTGGAVSANGTALDADVVAETHQLVKRLNKQSEDRSQLEAQTLRQVAAEVRLIRLRDESAAR